MTLLTSPYGSAFMIPIRLLTGEHHGRAVYSDLDDRWHRIILISHANIGSLLVCSDGTEIHAIDDEDQVKVTERKVAESEL